MRYCKRHKWEYVSQVNLSSSRMCKWWCIKCGCIKSVSRYPDGVEKYKISYHEKAKAYANNS